MCATDNTDLYLQRHLLSERRSEFEAAIALADDPRRVFTYSREIERIREEIERLTRLIEAEEATRSLQSIQAEVSAIRDEVATPDVVSSVEAKLQELAGLFEQTIEHSRARAVPSSFEPILSVIRPSVKLVDANLAYRYADLQADMNILFGLAALFLGTAISECVSLGISVSTAASASVIAVHWAVLAMSGFATAVLGWLTHRSWRKASEARSELETDAEMSESDAVPNDGFAQASVDG